MADEQATPLTDDELTGLYDLRVCGCGADDCYGCPTPVLDGIGADWIADHFENILATISTLTAERDDLKPCGVVTGVFHDRSTGYDDVSICENDRPCAEHPPEAWLTEKNHAEGAEEALAELKAAVTKQLDVADAVVNLALAEPRKRDTDTQIKNLLDLLAQLRALLG